MGDMKDHINTYAMLIGLGLLLATILVLASEGSKADGPLLIGIAGSVSTIVGAIAGKQLSSNSSQQISMTATPTGLSATTAPAQQPATPPAQAPETQINQA